jgi:4-hydroxybutyrate dehydrogenase
MEMIMAGYKEIVNKGEEERFNHLKEFLLASTYAGIAFGNAGCAAVHALSYSIGGAFHVPHGEANYQFFTEVFKMYAKKDPDGKIKEATSIFAGFIGCNPEDDVYGKLEAFLNKLIAKKRLREYGMNEKQIDEFTESTIANQQRLLVNNYVFLEKEEIREIFATLY